MGQVKADMPDDEVHHQKVPFIVMEMDPAQELGSAMENSLNLNPKRFKEPKLKYRSTGLKNTDSRTWFRNTLPGQDCICLFYLDP